ncbi:hypothetical protein FOMPIDRAFT_1132184 [Fomitopsis schrenkii]|uniref:Uncharacterized protein n=1 Tax=Fomitopsis schrenkii TaxID=2126942 RepID=S8DQG2_FOMSC|nr:hypothetical protein FOMPIDRAFT_1132184 [Fomitopsis schrenkii]
MSSKRPIQLLVYNSRLFNAHWSIFVPRTDNPHLGSRLHATGSVVGGFTLEFVRNYNVLSDNRPLQRIDLAVVPADCIKDTEGDEEIVESDARPIDRLEQVIVTVPAPGPSMRSATASRKNQQARVAMRDCQWWVKQAVAALIAAGVCSSEAQSVADKAPVH